MCRRKLAIEHLKPLEPFELIGVRVYCSARHHIPGGGLTSASRVNGPCALANLCSETDTYFHPRLVRRPGPPTHRVLIRAHSTAGSQKNGR